MLFGAYIEDLFYSPNAFTIEGGKLLLLGFCLLGLACLDDVVGSLPPLRVLLRHCHFYEEVLGIRHFEPI